MSRRAALALLAVAVAVTSAVAACGDADDDGAGPPVETTVVPFDREAAAIYAAVIRHVHEQEADDAERIFVRSRAGGERGEEAAVTIPLGVQAELVALLSDVAPLDFVDHPEEIVDDAVGELPNQGVLLRLGRIERVGDDHARVHVALYRSRDREHEATYDVVLRDGDWLVDEGAADRAGA